MLGYLEERPIQNTKNKLLADNYVIKGNEEIKMYNKIQNV